MGWVKITRSILVWFCVVATQVCACGCTQHNVGVATMGVCSYSLIKTEGQMKVKGDDAKAGRDK